MSETDVLDLFIGTKSSYEKHKRENNIDIDEPDEDSQVEKKEKVNGNVAVLSKETLKPIDDETMTILKRTRTAHSYDTVYMQSSLEFYDEYYNNLEMSPELKAARQIRRVYKVYEDYLNALDIRNEYIDSLIDKYGGGDEFQRKMSLGLVKDWIPKMPILSKRCPDYEMYLTGLLPIKAKTLPEGTVNDIMESMQEELKDVELIETYDVETSIGLINDYERYVESAYAEYGYISNKSSSVTISDLNELNRIFKSWYKPENGKVEQVLFKNAPENIRKRFMNYCAFNEPGLLYKLGNGGDLEDEGLDMNELVHDSISNKSMTRRELIQRQNIRLLAKYGWSESRLLNYSNVGSKLEKLARKKKVGRKRKRSSTEFSDFDDVMNSPTGMDPIYSENNYMSEAFLNLMRGD